MSEEEKEAIDDLKGYKENKWYEYAGDNGTPIYDEDEKKSFDIVLNLIEKQNNRIEQLEKENKEKKQTQIFIDTENPEERYARETYIDCLKEKIEQLEKENETLKSNSKIIAKEYESTSKQLKCEIVNSFDSIPKSVIREKIEELYNKQDKEDEILSDKGFDLGMRNYLTTKEVAIKILKELLGEEKWQN